MIASPHIVAGSALGLWSFSLAKNKRFVIFVALIAGVISHFIIDLVPHQEYTESSLMLVCFVDSMLAITVSLRFGLIRGWNNSNWALIAGMFGGMLPDIPFFLIRLSCLNWGWLHMAAKVNGFFHAAPEWEPKISVIFQVVIVFVLVYSVKMNQRINMKLVAR